MAQLGDYEKEKTAMEKQIQSLEDNKKSVPSYIIFLLMFFLAFFGNEVYFVSGS